MRRFRPIVTCAAVAALIGTGWGLSRQLNAGQPGELPVGALSGMAELEQRNHEIAFFERRTQEDPYSAVDQARLASLFLQRAREAGDYEDFRRAEQAARKSLKLRDARNEGATMMLASALLAQHRFAESYEVAADLAAREPDKLGYRALLGELQLEMGMYDEARATFAALEPHSENLAVAPRLARWAELTGRTDEARRILYEAQRAADARVDLPREQVAWFHLRVADLELRQGRLDRAEKAIRSGLRVEPNDHRLRAAWLRLEAARGRWKEVARLGEQLGDAADLATLALIGDAHAKLGDPDRAEGYFRTVEANAAENPEPYNRQWTQFRLDHDREIPATLALLRDELQGRRDVLGYDMLAWAQYKAGDHRAAHQTIQQALRMGTRDATLSFHAGMIARAVGAKAEARKHLEQALEINPHFHHTYADQARAALRELK